MDAHKAAVAAIATRVREFHQTKTPFRLYHGSTNTTQHRRSDRSKVIDTSGLCRVLKVDGAGKTCLVEPNVPMDQLVDEVLPHGLVPPVVMEFPGITVGGGFAGTAGESSGFKYGFFDRTVNWIEMVLPDGEIVTASPTERSDLFYGAAGSRGTLGVATLFEVQLVEAKRYVEMTYQAVGGVAEALSVMTAATKVESNDYVDGILFAADHGAIISGRLTDDPAPEAKVQRFTRARDPLFYMHVERSTRRRRTTAKMAVRVATPLRDYLFRYDRGAFWTAKYAFQYFRTPYNRVTRWAAHRFLHTRVMYHALHASGHASRYVVQDVLLPPRSVAAFVEHVQARLGFWPLWLCPFHAGPEVAMHPDLAPADFADDGTVALVNVGVWGPGPTDAATFVEENRRLEGAVRSLGGIKWLYAQAYYTEEEFWAIYDRRWYDGLRDRCHAAHLPSVFEKVTGGAAAADERTGWSGSVRRFAWKVWPVSGVYGVVKTLYERDYLLAKG